jgi:hypothetical protein
MERFPLVDAVSGQATRVGAWAPEAAASDVDRGPSPGVFLDLAEHLARHRRGVALTEQQVPQQVRQRMTF